MSETRDFPTAVIASLSSGVLLCEFGKMHEAAEFLMGHPIWAHHFASKNLWRQMQARILARHPTMPTDMPGVTKENWSEHLARLVAEHGETVSIEKGDGETAMHPLEGMPEGKSVIAITTDA